MPLAGSVIIHDINVDPIIRKFKAEMPRAKPTPNTAPTNVCAVSDYFVYT